MNIQINERVKQIKLLHNTICIDLKNTIEKARKIGFYLIDIKNKLEYGQYIKFLEDNFDIGLTTLYKYEKIYLYFDKISLSENLQDAYKQIETIEKQNKRIEQQRKNDLIDQYIDSGIKPLNWNRSLDYEYQKRKKEDEERTRRIKETKIKMEESKQKAENEYKIFEEVNELVNDMKQKENEKIKIKQQIKMSINDDSKFIEALEEYLFTLDNDNIRLNACHNIIKYCKNKINEYQRQSIIEK